MSKMQKEESCLHTAMKNNCVQPVTGFRISVRYFAVSLNYCSRYLLATIINYKSNIRPLCYRNKIHQQRARYLLD